MYIFVDLGMEMSSISFLDIHYITEITHVILYIYLIFKLPY